MPAKSIKIALLKKINSELKNSLCKCATCPRKCGVNRSKNELGYCRAPYNIKVYSCYPHHGEEPPISGTKGSGTVFFSHCNMKCVYCQNYHFSQLDKGKSVSANQLSDMMLGLQEKGCHNINLVSPTHFLPQILSALEIAIEKGLSVPIVYNTSGYELPAIIRLLDGIVDIYLTDMRYANDPMALKYSDAQGYAGFNRQSVVEMQRQAGDLILDDNGIARKGLIIRLLALPGGISGTIDSLKFIRNSVSKNSYLSLMSQYYPTYKASGYKEISKGISKDEYKFIIDEAHLLGLNNGWIQQMPSAEDSKYFGTNINPNI